MRFRISYFMFIRFMYILVSVPNKIQIQYLCFELCNEFNDLG